MDVPRALLRRMIRKPHPTKETTMTDQTSTPTSDDGRTPHPQDPAEGAPLGEEDAEPDTREHPSEPAEGRELA